MRDRVGWDGRGRAALLAALGAATVAGLGWHRTARGDSSWHDQPSLVVWYVNNDRKGLAIALRYAAADLDGMQLRGDDGKPLTLKDVLSRLISNEGPVDSFRVAWVRGTERRSILFRLAKGDTLVAAWKPLFKCCRHNVCLDDWRAVEETFGDCYDRPRDAAAATDSVVWLRRLAEDLAASRPPVVILGPDSSDAVPPLWFALSGLSPERIPPILSIAATSPLLVKGPEADILWEKPDRQRPADHRLNWYNALGRMKGDCDARYDELDADSDPARAIDEVIRRIFPPRGPAAHFAQFSSHDGRLIDAATRYLADVQGFRRIGILFPDATIDRRDGRDAGRPSRLLYGPTLEDFFLTKEKDRSFEAVFPASFPSPASEEAWEKDDWLKKMRRLLQPTLRFFHKSGVEAVGVFGMIEAKKPLLAMVRDEIPEAQLFTFDADWELESPAAHADRKPADAPGSPRTPAVTGTPAGGRSNDATIEGLLVFTNPDPPRRWVQDQHRVFNSLAHGRAGHAADGPQESFDIFLPDIYQYYTDRSITNLFQLVSKSRDIAADIRDVNLVSRLRKLDAPSRRDPAEADLTADPDVKVLLIQGGRLGELADVRLASRNVILALLAFVVLLLFLSRMRPAADDTGGPRAPAQTPSPMAAPITPLEFLAAWLAKKDWEVIRTLKERIRRRYREDLTAARGGDRVGRREAIRGWFRATGSGLVGRVRSQPSLRGTITIAAIAVLFQLLILIDCWSGAYLSPSLLPNGHSLVPSLLFLCLAAGLAYQIPHRFRRDFGRRGLLTIDLDDQNAKLHALQRWLPRLVPTQRWANYEQLQDLEGRFDEAVKDWVKTEVYGHLRLTPTEFWGSLLVAVALTGIDCGSGLPVPDGGTRALLVAFEFVLLWIVVATGWTLFEIAFVPAQIEGSLRRFSMGNPGAPGMPQDGFFLRHLDVVSVRRMGTIFIETIASLLVVYGLLLVARLPRFGMPRWRWGLSDFPLGMLLAILALAFILGYWLYCYRTLVDLIRNIKRERLEELALVRAWALKESMKDVGGQLAAERGKLEEGLVKLEEEYERKRREIDEIPEQPWKDGDSRRATLTLLLAVSPPILSALLGGGWGERITQFLGPLFQG